MLPTRKEITFFYKTHRSRFQRPDRLRLLHIIKNVDEAVDREEMRVEIEKAYSELRNGIDFAEVAERYSDCPGAQGDLGWVSRGVMVEEFEERVFTLEPGQTSDIFATRFGWHLVKVLDRRRAGIAPLSEVYDQISDSLRTEGTG